MKVMLIQPPSAYHRETYPLGLAYLGAILEKHGCKIKALDASALNCFMDEKDIVREVETFPPDFVGITLLINQIEKGYLLAREISRLGIPVIAGGPHANLRPHEILNNHFDIVVRGEGELTVLDLIDYFEGKRAIKDVLGISYRNSRGEIKDNPDRPYIENLDEIPYPARHLFPVSNYVNPGKEENEAYWTILTSRGCPRKCIYCVSVHGAFGGRYRFRSAENVYEELVYLKENHDIHRIKFYDDTLTVNRKRINDLCDLIIQDKELNIKWTCDSRVDSVTEDLIKKMKEAGCYHIYYGIESYDPQTLKLIKKGINTEKIRKVINWTIETDIEFTMYFILGWPWENHSHINKTLSFIKSIPSNVKCKYSYFVPIPYPRTELYEINHKRYGFTEWWLKENAFERFYEDNRYIPYFRLNMSYMDHFYLKKNFFNHSKEFQKFLLKVFLTMGTIEMKRLYGSFKGRLVYLLSKFSFILHKRNPRVESVIFRFLWSEAIRGNIKKLLKI